MDKSLDILDNIPWDIYLPSIECNHNRCIHPATQYSPYELMTGRPFQFLTPQTHFTYSDLRDKSVPEFISTINHHMKIIQTNAKLNQQTYDKKKIFKNK